MASLDFNDSDPDDAVEPVPLTLPLDRKSREWLAKMAGDLDEEAEIIASIIRMVVDDDEQAHGDTKH